MHCTSRPQNNFLDQMSGRSRFVRQESTIDGFGERSTRERSRRSSRREAKLLLNEMCLLYVPVVCEDGAVFGVIRCVNKSEFDGSRSGLPWTLRDVDLAEECAVQFKAIIERRLATKTKRVVNYLNVLAQQADHAQEEEADEGQGWLAQKKGILRSRIRDDNRLNGHTKGINWSQNGTSTANGEEEHANGNAGRLRPTTEPGLTLPGVDLAKAAVSAVSKSAAVSAVSAAVSAGCNALPDKTRSAVSAA
eukprot:5290843-Prymnesium_polylepis.1